MEGAAIVMHVDLCIIKMPVAKHIVHRKRDILQLKGNYISQSSGRIFLLPTTVHACPGAGNSFR
jgi:hypothetical protein